MKNSLGRLFLILLALLHVELFASVYKWSAIANKQKAYVGEAIHLTYTCTFNDRAELYSIDFNPVGDYDKFTVELLTDNVKVVDGKKINTYEFVAFAKEAGNLEFSFDTIMKKTNEDSIRNTVLGRDNAFYEDFTSTTLKQKTIHVDVLKASQNLVGDFSLDVKKDQPQVKAYEPYHMNIKIKGTGYFDAIKPINFEIDGVKIFAGKLEKNIELTKSGFSGVLTQSFAFVSDKSFVIPELKISYFNLENKTQKSLTINSTNVEVVKGYVKKELLDDVESKFIINYEYIYYFLFFVTGFLVSKIKFKKDKSTNKKDNLFKDKVDNANSLNQLIVILALKDKNKYENIISDIETNKIKSLSKAKKEVIALI